MKAEERLNHEPLVDLGALRTENEALGYFLEHFGGGLALFGPGCEVLWTNGVTERRFGLPGPITGHNCREFQHRTDEQCEACPVARCFSTGGTQIGLMDLKMADGSRRVYELTATPIHDHDGSVRQVMCLGQDVTERVRLEKELQKRADRLEIQHQKVLEASRQKSRFIASLSHELRTPLTSVIGFTEILMEDSEEPLTPNQKRLLSRVSSNSERLLDMINDLLDLSKMESGRMAVNLSKVDISMLVRQVVETMQPLVRDKSIALVCETDDATPTMRTDEQKLSQILVNLISNAIKFTPSGMVMVSASLAGSKIAISVTDTGIGIRRTDFGRIFEEFHQLDGRRTHKEGSGLGLAITKQLVQLLGGEIKLSSKLGHGSTFTVLLPVSLSRAILDRRAAVQDSGVARS